jgi:hypothetical protein
MYPYGFKFNLAKFFFHSAFSPKFQIENKNLQQEILSFSIVIPHN